MITMVTIQMKVNEELTVYFNPPLLYVKEIQLNEVWTQFASYLIFCDAIDTKFSLANFENKDGGLNPSKLLGMFPRGESNIILPIHNKKELSNLTLTIKKYGYDNTYESQHSHFKFKDFSLLKIDYYV